MRCHDIQDMISIDISSPTHIIHIKPEPVLYTQLSKPLVYSSKPSSFPNVQGTPVTEEVILTAKVVKARSVAKDVPVVQVPSVKQILKQKDDTAKRSQKLSKMRQQQ